MYVIDITRDYGSTDILCGNDSMDAKRKTINYIINYTLANHNIDIDKNLLDQNLNLESFTLKNFLKENYSLSINDNLIIQSIITDKDNCLFVKYQDEKNEIPVIYTFNKKDFNIAHNVLTFLFNDGLIQKFKSNISEYDRMKLDYKQKTYCINNYTANIKSEIISLYNHKGKFIEELLNNDYSLNDIKHNKKMSINL